MDYKVDIEEAILACIIISPLAIEKCLKDLTADVFLQEKHQLIFLASTELYYEARKKFKVNDKNELEHPCDLYHLVKKLTELKVIDKIGGITELTKLQKLNVTLSNLSSYVAIAIEQWQRRCLERAGKNIVKYSKDEEIPVDESIQKAREEIEEVSNRKVIQLVTIEESGKEFIRTLDDVTPIYESSLSELNRHIVGYEPGKSYVIAGRTSMGKTQLALYESFMMSLRHQMPVIYFSLEMGRSELDARIFSLLTHHKSFESLSTIPHLEEAMQFVPDQVHPVKTEDFRMHRIFRTKQNKSYLTDGQRKTMNFILNHIYPQIPFSIDDEPNMTLTRMFNHIKKMQSIYGKSPLVVVDYISMIGEGFDEKSKKGNWSRVGRSQELKEIVYKICDMGKMEGTPMFLISQVNRDPESRADKRPLKSDLRESGSLEERVDGIFLLYRDEYYYPDETKDPGVIEINIAKNRQGKTGTVKAMIDLDYGALYDREAIF